MEYKIEKNIELPNRRTCNKYPLRKMEVGDSFLIGKYSRLNMNKASAVGRNWKDKAGLKWKFAVRKVLVNNIEMIRIWRIK